MGMAVVPICPNITFTNRCGCDPGEGCNKPRLTPGGRAPDPAAELARLGEASGDPDAFRLVHATLMATYESSSRVGHMTQFADEVAAVAVRALRQGGRLADPNPVTVVTLAHQQRRMSALLTEMAAIVAETANLMDPVEPEGVQQ